MFLIQAKTYPITWPQYPLYKFRKRDMSTFSKILNEKLKKQDFHIEETDDSYSTESMPSGLGIDLLKWLNSSELTKNHFYKVEDSSYSIYKKDPKVLEKQRVEREKIALNAFLEQIPSEKGQHAAMFFYTQGARSFMSLTFHDLKRDYKKLAFKLHPDRHFKEIPSAQRQFQENFRVLSESYELLKMLFSRAK